MTRLKAVSHAGRIGSGLVALALACFAAACVAQRPNPPDASSGPAEVLSAYAKPGKLPAVAVLVVKDGKPVYKAVAGTRVSGKDDPAETGDAFHLGSVTKSMTSLACAVLVDRGLLSWDTTVGEALGSDFEIRDEYRAKTLRQLLSHTAGFPAALPNEAWAPFFPYDSGKGLDRSALVAASLAAPPAAKDGGFLYSNFGYVVAGRIAEKAAGVPWEELIRREVFGPAGMSGSGFGPPAKPTGSAGVRPGPWGHSPKPVDPAYLAADNPVAMGPAGTAHATLDDMERYLSIYLNGGSAGDGPRIVSPESLTALFAPVHGAYALGWISGKTADGRRAMLHDGSNTMFYCLVAMLPEDGDGVVVMANRGDGPAGRYVTELTVYLARRFLGVELSD